MADEQLRLQATVVDQFSRPLTDLKNRLRDVSTSNASGMRGMTRDWQNIRGEMDKATSVLKTGFSPALAAVGGLSLGVGGALSAVVAGVRNFGASTQALSVFSKETGVAIDQVRAFGALGERWGTSAETMQGAIKNLSSGMFDLRQRWGKIYGELHGMGLQNLAEDLTKGTNQEALSKAFDFLAKTSDPEKRRRVSMVLFGTEDVGVVAAQVGGNLEKALGEIKARMGSLGPDQEKAARQFQGNLAEIQQSMENLKNQAFGPLVEQMNKWWEGVDKPELIKSFNTGLNLIKETIKTTKHELEMLDRGWERLSTGVSANDPRKSRADNIRQQIKDLEEGDTGLGGADRPAEVQRRIDKLNDELRQLTDELKKQGAGGTAQKSSFAPSGGMAGLIQQASLGGLGGGRILGGPGGGSAGLGGGYTGGAAGPGVAPALQGAPVLQGAPARIGAGTGIGHIASQAERAPARIGAGTGIGHIASQAERAEYIRRAAIARGINPDIALRVAQSEGFKSYVGDKGTSFGDWQLHVKNNIPGLSRGGLGDVAIKRGINIRDPNTWKAQTDFALDQAAKGGWGPWHGWRGHPGAGLDGARAIGSTPDEPNSDKAARRRETPWPNQWARRGANQYEEMGATSVGGRAFGNRMLGVPAGGQPQTIEGSAKIDLNVYGLGATKYGVKTSMDGMFKDVNVNKGRSMEMQDI